MTPEEKWKAINDAFKVDMEPFKAKEPEEKYDPKQNYTGGLAGARLTECSLAVIGINWGGDPTAKDYWDDAPAQQCILPTCGEGFGKPVSNLLSTALHDDCVMEKLLLKIFYTNRFLFQSAGMSNPPPILEKDLETGASEKAVARMLSIVKPSVVICFGAYPRGFILSDLCKQQKSSWDNSCDDYWIFKSTGRKENGFVYRFKNLPQAILPLDTQDPLRLCSALDLKRVWSFPHPVRSWPDGDFFANMCGEKKKTPILESLAEDLRACI